MNCFSIILVIIILYSLFNMSQREAFTIKNAGKKLRKKYNKNRRYTKNMVTEYYKNISNKMNAIKIKYL